MFKKIVGFLLPGLFIVFYSDFIYSQDLLNSYHAVAEKKVAAQHPNPRYLKPTALIAPGAFLLYGGLKPVINAIPGLTARFLPVPNRTILTFIPMPMII